MSKQIRENWLVYGGYIVVVVAILLLTAFLWREKEMTGGTITVPLDDAWIHAQFASHLTSGEGFAFNLNQPTPGSTAPLWTVLLATVGFVVPDYIIASLGLSILFFAVTLGVAYQLSYQLSSNKALSFFVALLVAVSGRFLWAGLSGMEVTAFTCLSLAAIWLYQRQGISWRIGLLVGLASQLRPEAHLLFLIMGVDWGWRHLIKKEKGSDWKKPLWALVLYIIINLPYIFFALGITGKPLANTFYAKTGLEDGFFHWRALEETLNWHFKDNYLLFLLVPVGLYVVWGKNRVLAGWFIGLILAIPFLISSVWHHGRYTMPLIPIQIILAVVGGDWILSKLWGRGKRSWTLDLVLALILLSGSAVHLSDWSYMLGQNSLEILEIDVAAGNWIRENLPEDAIVGVDDIGAIAFLGERQVFDLNGLVSPEMWPVLTQKQRKGAHTADLLYENNVEYLAIFPSWHPELTNNPMYLEPIHELSVPTRTIIGGDKLTIYKVHSPYVKEVAIGNRYEAVFEDKIKLLGYQFGFSQGEDRFLALVLAWESLADIDRPYHVFIHLVDQSGNIITQLDQEPFAGLASTQYWKEGDQIMTPVNLDVPDDILPGQYQVNIGLYFQETMERLTLSSGGEGDILPLFQFVLNQPQPSGQE